MSCCRATAAYTPVMHAVSKVRQFNTLRHMIVSLLPSKDREPAHRLCSWVGGQLHENTVIGERSRHFAVRARLREFRDFPNQADQTREVTRSHFSKRDADSVSRDEFHPSQQRSLTYKFQR